MVQKPQFRSAIIEVAVISLTDYIKCSEAGIIEVKNFQTIGGGQ